MTGRLQLAEARGIFYRDSWAKGKKKIYIYLLSTYLFNLLAGLGCWIWFYILNYKIYDGNVCQLFSEGKKDLCSFSSLIIEPRVLHVCLEMLKYVKSKNKTLAGLPFYIFCSFLLTVFWAVSWYLLPGPLHLVSSQTLPIHLAKGCHSQNQLRFSGKPQHACFVYNVIKHISYALFNSHNHFVT